MTMENESIFELSSSEFDSIPDLVDSLGSDSIAEQDPAEQEQPEQEEQGSADSSEPDSDTDIESVYDTDYVTESAYDESSDFDSGSESEDAVTVLVSQPDFSPVVEELQRIEGIGVTLLLSIAFAAAFVIAYWFFRIWNYFTRF